ncbi:Tetracycline resistance protein, class B [BD1-7 clade bacterium]|uniref:Tetracycline resistance protein, class B n=1 Tax=BD1-7 clade bacterium TaxID=2029982 RepID=A0A5S9QCC1_9GAMM|nr:Tetracycline resistance protein, class B [BD1-7 clade bacterium]
MQPQSVLLLAMLTVGMGQTVIFAVMPMLGRALSLDQLVLQLPLIGSWAPKELAITALSAITALTFALISPWWGRYSDKVGRKPIVVIGLLGYTVGALSFSGAAWLGLAGLASGLGLYGVLLLTRILHAALMSASFPAATAYMVDNSPIELRTQSISRLSAAMQLGVMIGPALAWFIHWGYLVPFILQAGFTLVAGLLVWRLLPHHAPLARPAQAGKPPGMFDARFRRYTLMALAAYGCLGMVQQTLGFYFQDVLAVDGITAAKEYSLAMIVSSGAMLVTQLIILPRLNWQPNSYIRLGMPALVIGFVSLALADSHWMLILGMGGFGLGMGFCGPSFTAAASLQVEAHEQGALAGLIGAVAGMGFMLGPMIGGVLYAMAPSYPYLLAVAIAIVLLIFVNLPSRPAVPAS